jgi:predicted MFS family arabinose efflux permease
MLASSSIQASANMGNAFGAYLGGLPIAAGFGYISPLYIGATLAFTGFVICLILAWKYKLLNGGMPIRMLPRFPARFFAGRWISS